MEQRESAGVRRRGYNEPATQSYTNSGVASTITFAYKGAVPFGSDLARVRGASSESVERKESETEIDEDVNTIDDECMSENSSGDSSALVDKWSALAKDFYTEERLRDCGFSLGEQQEKKKMLQNHARGSMEASRLDQESRSTNAKYISVTVGEDQSPEVRQRLFERVGKPLSTELCRGNDALVLFASDEATALSHIWGSPNSCDLNFTSDSLMSTRKGTNGMSEVQPTFQGLIPSIVEYILGSMSAGKVSKIKTSVHQGDGDTVVLSGEKTKVHQPSDITNQSEEDQDSFQVYLFHEDGYWLPIVSVRQAFLLMNENIGVRDRNRDTVSPNSQTVVVHGLRVRSKSSDGEAFAFFSEMDVSGNFDEQALKKAEKIANKMFGAKESVCSPLTSHQGAAPKLAWRSSAEKSVAEHFLFLRGSTIIVPEHLLSMAIRMVRYAGALQSGRLLSNKFSPLPKIREALIKEQSVFNRKCLPKTRAGEHCTEHTHHQVDAGETIGQLRQDACIRILSENLASTSISGAITQTCLNLKTQAVQNLYKRVLDKHKAGHERLEHENQQLKATCQALRIQREEAMDRLKSTHTALEAQKHRYIEVNRALMERERQCDNLREDLDGASQQLKVLCGEDALQAVALAGNNTSQKCSKSSNSPKPTNSASVPWRHPNDEIVSATRRKIESEATAMADVLKQSSRLSASVVEKLRMYSNSTRLTAKQVTHRSFLQEVSAILAASRPFLRERKDQADEVKELRIGHADQLDALKAQVSRLQKVNQAQRSQALDQKRELSLVLATQNVKHAETEMAQLERRIEDLENLLETKDVEVEELKAEAAQAQSRQTNIDVSIRTVKADTRYRKSCTEGQQNEQSSLKEMLLAKERENESLSARLMQSEAKVKTQTEARKSLSKQLSQATQQLFIAQHRRGGSKSESDMSLKALQERVAKMSKGKAYDNKIVADLQRSCEQLRKDKVVLEESRSKMQRRISALEEETVRLRASKAAAAEIDQALQDSKKSVETLTKAEASLQDQLAVERTLGDPAILTLSGREGLSIRTARSLRVHTGLRALLGSLALQEASSVTALSEALLSCTQAQKALREEEESHRATSDQLADMRDKMRHVSAHREAQKSIVEDLELKIAGLKGHICSLKSEVSFHQRRAAQTDSLPEQSALPAVKTLISSPQQLSARTPQSPNSSVQRGSMLSRRPSFKDAWGELLLERCGSNSNLWNATKSSSRVISPEASSAVEATAAISAKCTRQQSASLLHLAHSDIDALEAELNKVRTRSYTQLVFERAAREAISRKSNTTLSAYKARISELEAMLAPYVGKQYTATGAQTDAIHATQEEIGNVCNELLKMQVKVKALAKLDAENHEQQVSELNHELQAAFEKAQYSHLLKEKWKAKHDALQQQEQSWNLLLQAQVKKSNEQLDATRQELSRAQIKLEESEHVPSNDALSASPKMGNQNTESVPPSLSTMMSLFAVSPHITEKKRKSVGRILEDLRVTFCALDPFLECSPSNSASVPNAGRKGRFQKRTSSVRSKQM